MAERVAFSMHLAHLAARASKEAQLTRKAMDAARSASARRPARGGPMPHWDRRRATATCVVALGLSLAGAGAFSALGAGGLVAHFGLAKSAPEADATIAPPAEVRLWFTQAPADGSVTVRVVDAKDGLVAADSLRQDADDSKAFRVAFPEPLEAGRYSVRWRGIGQDGHAARGRFSFWVRSP